MKKILDILSCIWTAFLILTLLIFAGGKYIGNTFEEYGEKVRESNKKVEVFNKDVKEFEQRNKRLFRSPIKRQREGKELERRHKELERMQKEIKEEFVEENLLLIAILHTIEKHTRWEKEESND